MDLSDWGEAAEQALAAFEPDVAGTEAEELLGQADAEVDEQAEEVVAEAEAEEAVEAEEDDELFGDEDAQAPTPPPDISSMTFSLPGLDTPVSFQELKDGYLRNADYTRKTQQVADQRKQADKALKLWDAITADPVAVARQMAVQAGLLAEDAAPIKNVEFSPIKTAEEVEAEVAKRVQEELSKHPAVIEATTLQAQAQIEQEFAQLEQAHGVTLGPKSRRAILQRSLAEGVTNLDLVFKGLLAEKAARQKAAEQVKQAAPTKPSSRTVKREVTEAPGSWEEAARRAAMELQTA